MSLAMPDPVVLCILIGVPVFLLLVVCLALSAAYGGGGNEDDKETQAELEDLRRLKAELLKRHIAIYHPINGDLQILDADQVPRNPRVSPIPKE